MASAVTQKYDFTPHCKCHGAAVSQEQLQTLKPKADILERACVDGDEQKVLNFLVQEAATGALPYLMGGLRTSIHGKLLGPNETRGMEESHSTSPFWCALFNKHIKVAELLVDPTILNGIKDVGGPCEVLSKYSEDEKAALPQIIKKIIGIDNPIIGKFDASTSARVIADSEVKGAVFCDSRDLN